MERDRDCDDKFLITLLEEDNFKRNLLINDFIKMLNSVEYNTYIALDGEWGSGKTIFVKELELLNRVELKKHHNLNEEIIEKFKDKYSVFYYNAWENDYHGDPLQSILINLISKQKLSKKAFQNIKDALITIFSDSSEEFIKNITKGFIDIKKIKDPYSDKYVIDVISIEKRKNLVSKIMDELCEKEKLLIILDELDRCSPTFAVRLLETVKHYFDKKDIVFLISTHNSTLAHTVKKFYGNEFNGGSYLDKFYDLRINLPDIDKMAYAESKKYSSDYCEVVSYFKLSLREINHFDSMLEICNIRQTMNTQSYKRDFGASLSFEKLISFCLGLKIKNPQEFDKLINDENNESFLKYLEYCKRIEDINDHLYQKYVGDYTRIRNDKNLFDSVKNTIYLMHLLSPIDTIESITSDDRS